MMIEVNIRKGIVTVDGELVEGASWNLDESEVKNFVDTYKPVFGVSLETEMWRLTDFGIETFCRKITEEERYYLKDEIKRQIEEIRREE